MTSNGLDTNMHTLNHKILRLGNTYRLYTVAEISNCTWLDFAVIRDIHIAQTM